jgi:hypothetical protein
MKTNFKPSELILKNGKHYPIVGGRLRLAHEDNAIFTINTDLVQYEPCVMAVVKATVQLEKGSFHSYGSASNIKDQKLSESLLELSETRANQRHQKFIPEFRRGGTFTPSLDRAAAEKAPYSCSVELC